MFWRWLSTVRTLRSRVSLAEQYPAGGSNLLENLVQQRADQNEPAASDYAMTKSAGEERDRLLSQIAFARSKEDPADAAKLVAEWISTGEIQNEAAITVLHQWALRDPDAVRHGRSCFPPAFCERALDELSTAVPKQSSKTRAPLSAVHSALEFFAIDLQIDGQSRNNCAPNSSMRRVCLR
jgi:hypothetical protein